MCIPVMLIQVLVLVLVGPVLEKFLVLYCWLLTDEIQYCWLAFQRVDSYIMYDDDCGKYMYVLLSLMLLFQYSSNVTV